MILAAALLLWLPACGGDGAAADAGPDGPPPVAGCMVTAPTECPEPSPRYADVAPIFAERCVVCHGTIAGHWPLNTYRHVADWHAEIRTAMLTCSMPPQDAGITMPVEERELILDWLRCGYPE